MIAFNFNIHFQDEPSLNDHADGTKATINVVQSKNQSLFDQLTIKSDYLPLSGRNARYGAEKTFEECSNGCTWGVEVQGVISFVWNRGEHTITYLQHEMFTTRLLQFWVLHTILPMLLTLEGSYTILHAGAIEIDDKVVVFSAESFGGKSTLIDFFLKQGHNLLSDDTLGVYKKEGSFMAVTSYPFHRPYREVESLGYKTMHVVKSPKPIEAIYLLTKSACDAEIRVEEVHGVIKYKALHDSNFINYDFLKEQRFKFFTQMANEISVFKITIPWMLERIPAVYSAIINHVNGNKRRS